MKSIETERLVIRDWTMDDVDDLYEYAKNKLVGPNAGWYPHTSIEESKRVLEMFIKNGDVFAVALKESNKVIGSIGLHKRQPDERIKDKHQIEVGYVLNPAYWGRGYIPEVLENTKGYCFDVMGVEILWCGHYDFNNNSKRVAEKCGFNYQFTKDEVLPLMDDMKVKTLYYKIERVDWKLK